MFVYHTIGIKGLAIPNFGSKFAAQAAAKLQAANFALKTAGWSIIKTVSTAVAKETAGHFKH